MSILAPHVVDWLREGRSVGNPQGLLLLNDGRGRPVIADAELGEALLLGLVERYRPLSFNGFEGVQLTALGRRYLMQLDQRARLLQRDDSRFAKAAKVNPFAGVSPAAPSGEQTG